MRSCVHAYSGSIDLHPTGLYHCASAKRHIFVNGCKPGAGVESYKMVPKIVLGFVMQGSDLIGFWIWPLDKMLVLILCIRVPNFRIQFTLQVLVWFALNVIVSFILFTAVSNKTHLSMSFIFKSHSDT